MFLEWMAGYSYQFQNLPYSRKYKYLRNIYYIVIIFSFICIYIYLFFIIL